MRIGLVNGFSTNPEPVSRVRKLCEEGVLIPGRVRGMEGKQDFAADPENHTVTAVFSVEWR